MPVATGLVDTLRCGSEPNRRAELTVRASNALYLYPDQPYDRQIARFRAFYSAEPGRRLRFNQAKLYVDGILDLGTSALETPYLSTPALETPGAKGLLYFDVPSLESYVRELEAIGYQLHFHATGDRAVRLAMDAVEKARQSNGINDRRHRITHLYLVGEPEKKRFSTLGMVADFQLSPDAIPRSYHQFLAPYLGKGRADSLLPVQSVADRDAVVTLSSDWDAGPLPPFGAIERALTRYNEPVETLEDALRMMTLNPAFLLHQEDSTGSIEVGKRADLVVIDRNLFEIPRAEISKTRVLLTLLDGETVYSSGELQAGCLSNNTALCLESGRFEVQVAYRDYQGNAGEARVVPVATSNSGLFYFFHQDNWEILIKVLDGCAVNDRYWVFAAATTDIEYTLSVTDTNTGDRRKYDNPLGRASPAITDTGAFATCSLGGRAGRGETAASH